MTLSSSTLCIFNSTFLFEWSMWKTGQNTRKERWIAF